MSIEALLVLVTLNQDALLWIVKNNEQFLGIQYNSSFLTTINTNAKHVSSATSQPFELLLPHH